MLTSPHPVHFLSRAVTVQGLSCIHCELINSLTESPQLKPLTNLIIFLSVLSPSYSNFLSMTGDFDRHSDGNVIEIINQESLCNHKLKSYFGTFSGPSA